MDLYIGGKLMKFNKLDGPYSGFVPFYCMDCKHLGKYKESVPTCSAYPDGIPVDIWKNEDSSNNLCKGGNGFVFEEVHLYEEDMLNLPELIEDL